MIVLSPDAVGDVAGLRPFLNEINPDAARRAIAAILNAIERLGDFPDPGKPTEDANIRQIIIRYGESRAQRRSLFSLPRGAVRDARGGWLLVSAAMRGVGWACCRQQRLPVVILRGTSNRGRSDRIKSTEDADRPPTRPACGRPPSPPLVGARG